MTPCTAPHLTRRHALASALALTSLTLLGACGGAEGDELRDPRLLLENQALRERAQAAVNAGLVGAVFGSQRDSADKLYLGAAGQARLKGDAMTGSESFQLASLSKAMTAALVAHWVEQGKLRWDSRPTDLLPEAAAKQHPAYANATLAQLLDHRSGLPTFNDPAEVARIADFVATLPLPHPATDAARRRVLSGWLLSLTPVVGAGEFAYSNAGYTAAGAMLEAATGQDFETLMRQWAEPRGLQPQWQPPANAAQGHEGPAPGRLLPATAFAPEVQPWVDAAKPSGDVWMGPAGYGQWLAEHQRAFQGRSHSLPAAYVQRLRTLGRGDYALGWEGSWLHGKGALVHSGADQGFMGLTVLAQDGRSAYFALTNTLSVEPDSTSWVMDALNRGLLDLLNR
ncbi:serine hydrolase [Acidovorax sp. NB1]|uniref:serine hydrolase domain-containing protein n=1 Tax=Acidovorax sp. NB1 TaxID=1943571 RepID=UPI0010E39536|nr:serine hydrolase domain-containing protein [Acidovorax sp. NB1]GDY38257.1 hypothetical protein ACINB_41490 [Acidovorax sp. NB1]